MNEKANRPLDALPQDGTKVTVKLKTGEILTGCWYHDEPRKSFYKYRTGCYPVGAVEWWAKEDNGNG
jgi:hypothetical protein